MGIFRILFELKWTALKNSFLSLRRRSKVEFAALLVFFTAAAAGLFFFFYFGFRFFRGQEPFGPILIDETLYLFNFALFIMLLISSGVSAYASLFQSKEIGFLLARPIPWPHIYFIRLIEILWQSSWALLFITVPFMTAYGLNKDVSALYYAPLCLLFYVPFILLAALLGTLIAVLLVRILPGRRSRFIAFLLAGIFITIFFFKTEPQFIKEQGSLAGVLSGYLPQVNFAKNAFLPSSWITHGLLALRDLRAAEHYNLREGIFYFLLLLSNALFFTIPSYSAAKQIYAKSYMRAQDHAGNRSLKRARGGLLEKFFDILPWPHRPALGFLEKDIKSFLREPAEWSQLLIFFGVLLFYFANLKNLQFHVLKEFWKNLVFILNTIGTYVVLSSFSMRFIFPMLSLEGSRAWVIGAAPVRPSTVLIEKFFLGTVFSLLLTLPLVFLSGWMLEISKTKILFTTGLGGFVCVALTGLSVGFGAKFINLKSGNPAEIISGFGGSMLLAAHLAYLALLGMGLVLSKNPTLFTFFGLAGASLLAGAIPLKLGVNAIKKLEYL